MEELEGIVQRMIDAGESEDAIAKVVQHYNDKPGKTSDPASVEATAGSENNMASSSETGLSESQGKPESTWQSIQNSWDNMIEQFDDVREFWGDEDGKDAAKDIATNAIYSTIYGQENLKNKDAWLGGDMGSVNTLEALDRYQKDQQEMKATKGIVDSWKKGDIGGVLAGGFNAITNMIGSVAYGTGTAGMGYLADFTARNYLEYNKQKAENLGVSMSELVTSGQADNLAPVGFGALSMLSEGISTAASVALTVGPGKTIGKFVPKSVLNKVLYSKKRRAALAALISGSGEMVTEMTQHAVDEINDEMGRVAGTDEKAKILETYYEAMTSEEGLEAGLQGFVGGAGMTTGGYVAREVSNVRSVVDGDNLEKNLSELASLRLKLGQSNDDVVRNGIEAKINDIEMKIADSVIKGNKIYQNLDDGQLNQINGFSDLADATAFKITELNKKLRRNEISEQDYTLAKEGLEAEYNTAKQGIADMKLEENIDFLKSTVKDKKSAKNLKTTILNSTIETEQAMDNLSEVDKKGKQEFRDNKGNIAGFTVGGKIFVNKEVARKTGQINVAKHEFLHKVMNAKVGSAAEQGKIVKQLRRAMSRDQRKIVDAEMRSRGYRTQEEFDTEYVSVFSDLIAQEKISFEKSAMGKAGDAIIRFFKGEGFDNISFKDGRGVYNFLKDYSKNNELSAEAEAAIGDVDLAQEGSLQMSKIDYGAIEQRKGELDGTRDKSMIVAYDENFFKETMRRLRNVKLDDNVKEDIARSFILDDKRGLTKLLMDYDANRNDSVMGYLNGFVPQTKRSLFDARLQEFYESDPRYKNIIQSTTDENVARTVERKKAKSTPDKKDLGPVARKLSSFTNVDRNKNEKFYNKEVEQKAKDLISREIKLGVKNGLNASQIADNIKGIVETDVRDLIRSEMGAISRKKGEIVIPNSFRSLLEFGYEQILKSYPLARVKKMPGLFKKEKIGFTDKVTKKENKPELKKDSYYRKDDFKIYKPTKTELIKFFTEGGYTTLVEKQKRFAVDMSGDFAKVEVDKILNNQDMLESIVEIADGNENIVGVIQAEKLIQDISDYLDTKSEEKYGGDVVQFSKTAHSISRENASLIPNIKNLITDNKGIFVRNYLNKVPNYIEKTVKDILRAEQDNLGIDRSQADKIAKEIGSNWRVKNFDAKAKKYNVDQATDFLLENIKYNLDKPVGFEAINAKLGFKNLQDLNSLDSINNARLAVKYLFDNLEFRDFVRFIMPAVTNPARLAGFEIKKAIKGFFVKPNEVKLNKKSARDVIFANQADIKNALNIKENTRGMFRDDNTFKHKKWYNNENSDFNNLDNDGQIAFAKDLYGKSQQEKKFMLKVIDLIKKAYDNKNLSLEQVQWLMRVLFAHQFSPGKVMAGVRYLPADVNGNILTRKQLHEQGLAYKNDEMVLEHMIPANYIRDAAYMYILTGDKNLLNQEIKNYDVAILPKLQDDKLRTTGVQSKMGINHKPGVNPLETRYDGTGLYFVDVTNGKVVGGPIQFSKSEVYQQDMSNKADRARLGPRKGLSVFDFDDTLAQTNSQVIVKMPDGKQFKINATEFALQSADLEAAGAVFDFSEFNKVIDGKKGPLFELAMKRQSKFGNQNIFVLTARPQESAYAIHAFLKGIGLEIPIDNITGLEDGRAEAKAEWIKEKAAQGYNDFYFADDAYKNVKAVQDMLSGLGLEPNVEQAKVQFSKSKTYGKPQFSKTLDQEFNDILEETKGVDSRTNVSKAAAKAKGESIKSTWFIPPGAEDFVGLIYQFLGKGVIGERQLKFFDEKLFKPFAKATAEMNRAKQAYVNGYQEIKKAFPGIRKRLNDRLSNGFMMQDAVRVYIWNKLGYDIPGLSQGEVQSMVRFVEKYSDITAYANSLAALTQDQGYIQPSENWVAGSIVSDINDLTTKTRRKAFLQEWIQNKNEIFSEKNLNKIESIYGSDFRSALEDMLWRMENGTNRKFGNNKLVNSFTNWVNNSVGAIMFFNMRSAVLQTISMFNFVNWSDNNPLKAGAAVANFDQYIKDFTFIFNSDMLKQRRSGLTTDINEAEIAAAVRGKGNTPQAILRYLLTKGFMPTQMADSFAIASGGATFYRNRINTYLQQGMSETEAQKQAFEDFAEISEKTQQSARPDLISQQQAGPLGRLILAFQNTPMQYTRLMKKAYLDLINGRGDAKTNISKIAYYGFLQNLLFTTLQSALFALMFEDDEDEKEEMLGKKGPRILNNMADTILRGTGIYGAGVSTVKNIILKFREQEAKGFRADHTYTVIEFMNLSPPIGSKARRLYSGIQTYKFNKDIIPEYGFGLGNPIYQSIGNVVAAATNVPLDRLFNKINNVRASLNRENETWQRIANFLGWNTWDVGSEYDPSLKKLKEKVKKQKKRDRKRSNSRNQKARDAAYERYRKNK
jgi:hypothetical protein